MLQLVIQQIMELAARTKTTNARLDTLNIQYQNLQYTGVDEATKEIPQASQVPLEIPQSAPVPQENFIANTSRSAGDIPSFPRFPIQYLTNLGTLIGICVDSK